MILAIKFENTFVLKSRIQNYPEGIHLEFTTKEITRKMPSVSDADVLKNLHSTKRSLL